MIAAAEYLPGEHKTAQPIKQGTKASYKLSSHGEKKNEALRPGVSDSS